MSFAPGLPRDPRQVQEAKAKLNDTGTVYEPEREAPKFPEAKKTTVEGAAPAMGTMVTNIPAFAQQVYGTNAPSHEAGDPLALHGKDAHIQQQPTTTTKIDAAPPPIGGSKPAPAAPAPPPAPLTPPPAQTTTTTTPPPPPAPAPAAPATAQQTQQQQQQQPTTTPEIPKNAKKVVTTTTTTTKIVDGKEVVETHVHHDVIVKKGFGMPKFLKNVLGSGKKKTTTTTTTTTTSK